MTKELNTRFQGRLGTRIRGDPVTIEKTSTKSGFNLKPSPPPQVSAISVAALYNLVQQPKEAKLFCIVPSAPMTQTVAKLRLVVPTVASSNRQVRWGGTTTRPRFPRCQPFSRKIFRKQDAGGYEKYSELDLTIQKKNGRLEALHKYPGPSLVADILVTSF
jgi:hypothetical protein